MNEYYCEAFGIMRALVALNYGSFGAVNTPTDISNVIFWLSELKIKTLDLKNKHGIEEAIRIYKDKFKKKK